MASVLAFVSPGSRVLDLGAGQGRIATRMAQAGAIVVAVDQRAPAHPLPPEVKWHATRIEHWIARIDAHEQFDVILAKNTLQFFASAYTYEVLLPALREHTRPGGIIAIETFWRAPDPPFERPFAALYDLEDLQAAFSQWNVQSAERVDEIVPDMHGQPRRFFFTRLIVQRPPQ